MNAIIGGVVRALLALFAGTIGTTNEDIGAAITVFIDGLLAGDPDKIGSAALTVAVILWSVYDKKKRKG